MTRNHKVKSHYGANDYYKYYLAAGGTRSRREFGDILKDINSKIADKILDGYSFKMPSRMGIIGVTRKKEFVGFKDGKAVTNRPIDFKATMDLWASNPEAKAEKKLVRFINKHTRGWIYKISYNRHYATYKNKSLYRLRIHRDINRKLAVKLFNGFELEELV